MIAERKRTAALTALLALASALAWVEMAKAQVPADECLAATEFDDADFGPLLAELSDPALCLTKRRIEENGSVWRLIVIRNRTLSGPLWAVPHDEENVAFAAGIYAVRRYGGGMVAIENGEQRRVDGLDPNHIFATTQSVADICPGTQAPAPDYVAAFLGEWNRDYPVIGLHSNWDGYLDGGGLGTISVYRKDDKMIPFPSEVGEGRFADEDTIAMLVSALPPNENGEGQAAIAWFNDHGIHVIYRHVTEANNGCTLADYLTLNRLGLYINLEVERGDAETQPGLIDRLIEFLGSPANRGML